MPALLAWQTEFRRSEVAYAASISLDDIPRKTGAASVGFKRVFEAPAYNDRSFWTTHRAPQIAAEADHPQAQRSPWLVESHNRGRGARGLPRSGRSRSLLSTPSAQARLWPLAHIGAPVPALRREPSGDHRGCRSCL